MAATPKELADELVRGSLEEGDIHWAEEMLDWLENNPPEATQEDSNT